VSLAPVAIATGIIIAKSGHYTWAVHAGFFITAVATGHFPMFQSWTLAEVWVPLSVLAGIGSRVLYPGLSSRLRLERPLKICLSQLGLYIF
jgi:hypothetical protein